MNAAVKKNYKQQPRNYSYKGLNFLCKLMYLSIILCTHSAKIQLESRRHICFELMDNTKTGSFRTTFGIYVF